MSTKLKVTIIASSLAILLFTVVGGFVNVRASSNDGAYRQLSVYSEVLSRIRLEYVEEPNIAGVTDGALHGLLESLDANSSYLSAEEYKRYKAMKNGGKADIGATVSKRFGYADVVAIIPGGPAEKAGIENSDIIESIEGKSTHDMSLAEIRSLLSGEVGSTVTVAVVRPRRAEPQKIVITRDMVTIPPAAKRCLPTTLATSRSIHSRKGSRRRSLAKFAICKSRERRSLCSICATRLVAWSLKASPPRIFFLTMAPSLICRDRNIRARLSMLIRLKDITKLPVAVLVNRGTAGPAEIVASAILENARGDVVGDKTFGDGSVQKLIEMPDNSALILSIAKYYSPSGKAIQDAAVTPNVMVADAAEDDGGLPDEDQRSSAISRREERREAEES